MSSRLRQLLTPERVQILFWLALMATSVLALMPGPDVPVSTRWDKADHALAFLTLALLAGAAWPQQPWWRLALALLGYGVLIEIVQSFLPSREASLLDLVADSTGLALYAAGHAIAGRGLFRSA